MDWNQENPGRKRGIIFWAFLASLLIHVGFWLSKMDLGLLPPPEAEKPIEITRVPPEPPTQAQMDKAAQMEKQIAETEKADNDKLDPEARFLSDRTQTAEKQTRARATDDFRKKKGTGADQGQMSGNIPPTLEKDGKSDDSEMGESLAAKKKNLNGVKRDWKTLSLKDLSVGGDGGATAATDDRLNDVENGENTVLSTREFRYFSYYHRIKEMLRQYWKPNVERKLTMLWSKGKNFSDDEITTKLLVLLDEKGTISKISKVSSSGVLDLDEAAVEAFQRAAPFPNPPKGIIDEDGFVRIRWDFILKTEAAPKIQFRNVGNPRPMP